MQIDPRTLKQLIELQLMNSINLQGTALQSSSSTDSSNSMFNLLLQEMMEGGQGTSSLLDDMSSSNSSAMIDGQLWQYLPASTTTDTAEATAATPAVSADSTSSSSSSKATAYNEIIKAASQKYGVSESLIKAVIDTESSFKPNVVSSAGAKGLMQLMDGTAQGLGVSDPMDPAQNIDGGVRYLSYQLQRFGGQEKMALAAYNAGPGRLNKLGISSDQELMDKLHMLPVETQNYIGKIERARQKYEV
ncbi:lytic transglycosylase [Paenibacillus sp. CAA11]|uniref:lytic transglycosylase domain-containing protein n=1 Tax=Paenibacillus sp. CAA11 TaxID=1532905 RepID=UPI000D36D6FA|nr:lytic transglycosylase domain-containing protein [Paenibacillus sp. CAA11]AWB45390.1 lytic transglycosylase [Paenibacillus sp. CAA11]